MIFEVNASALKDAVNTGIINANISKYYKKSSITQIKAYGDHIELIVNYDHVITQLNIPGEGDFDSTSPYFVDSATFKQLINTIDCDIVFLDFIDGGIIISTTSSKFTVSNIVNTEDFELSAPSVDVPKLSKIPFDSEDWKFIKTNQLYALANNFLNPIYTMVYVGNDSDVIVGDYDHGIFTHSKKTSMQGPCLFKSDIINLFTSLDGDPSVYINTITDPKHASYILTNTFDTYSYISEIFPIYEGSDYGEYHADLILNTFEETQYACNADANAVYKFLTQVGVLSNSNDSVIQWKYQDSTLTLSNKVCKCELPTDGECCDYTIKLPLDLLQSIFSKYIKYSEPVNISPRIVDGDFVGILITNSDVETVLAAVE